MQSSILCVYYKGIHVSKRGETFLSIFICIFTTVFASVAGFEILFDFENMFKIYFIIWIKLPFLQTFQDMEL